MLYSCYVYSFSEHFPTVVNIKTNTQRFESMDQPSLSSET